MDVASGDVASGGSAGTTRGSPDGPVVAVAVQLRLLRARQTAVGIRVAPLAAVLAGARFAGRPWPELADPPGWHPAQRPRGDGTIVHASGWPTGPGPSKAVSCPAPGSAGAPPYPAGRYLAGRCLAGRGQRPALDVGTRVQWWRRLRTLLESDLTERVRQLGTGGMPELLGSLCEQVRFVDDTVVVETTCRSDSRIDTERLTLVPTLLSDRAVVVVADGTGGPQLLYPVAADLVRRWLGGASPAAADVGDLVRLLWYELEPERPAAAAVRDRLRRQHQVLHEAGLLGRSSELASTQGRSGLVGALACPRRRCCG